MKIKSKGLLGLGVGCVAMFLGTSANARVGDICIDDKYCGINEYCDEYQELDFGFCAQESGLASSSGVYIHDQPAPDPDYGDIRKYGEFY